MSCGRYDRDSVLFHFYFVSVSGEPAVSFDTCSVSFPAGSTALGFTLFSSHRSVSPTAPQADWIGLVEAMKQELATTESRLRTERADSTAAT